MLKKLIEVITKPLTLVLLCVALVGAAYYKYTQDSPVEDAVVCEDFSEIPIVAEEVSEANAEDT